MGFFDALSSATLAAETGVTEATGRRNKERFNGRFNLDPQWRNLFEIIVYSPGIAGIATAALSSITPGSVGRLISSGDQTMNLNALSVACPLTGYEYDWAGDVQYVKDIQKADTITFTLLEDENGNVRQYLTDWMLEIAEPDNTGGGFLSGGGHITYKFSSDQKSAKKNCKILLLDRKGLPNDIILKVDGLRPKNISEVMVEHAAGDPLVIQAQFAIDNAMWESLSGGLMTLGSNAIDAVKSAKSTINAFR